MDKKIFDAIREGLVSTYNCMIQTEIDNHIYFNKNMIGKEKTDLLAPRVNKVVEFINPKTGRVNHKTLRNQYKTYTYTQEMFVDELNKKIAKFENKEFYEIHLQTEPTDYVTCIRIVDLTKPTDEEIEKVYNSFGKRAEHLVGLRIKTTKYFGENGPYNYNCTYPMFDDTTMEDFEKSKEAYYEAKSKFCAKYGCD